MNIHRNRNNKGYERYSLLITYHRKITAVEPISWKIKQTYDILAGINLKAEIASLKHHHNSLMESDVLKERNHR
ncbi:hypothetical protein V1477_019917 [Vespula maculifrons]|uniref:Uncharacterized protein n=1 Tax=Vespula maculifrons TaxID=7453 RepID=A0ABD2AKF7_VESMC